MEIPKSFRPEKKDLKEKTEQLLKQPRIYNTRYNTRVTLLLESCEEFLQKQEVVKWFLNDVYQVAEEIADKTDYTKKDLEDLIKRIKVEKGWDEHLGFYEQNLGFYLSALVNKVITEQDKLALTLNTKLTGVGAFLEKGELIIKGNTESHTGYGMCGGKMILEGDAGDLTGVGMKTGLIIVEGNNPGTHLGCEMKGGKVIIYGQIGTIADSCRGTIYNKEKKIWPTKWEKLWWKILS